MQNICVVKTVMLSILRTSFITLLYKLSPVLEARPVVEAQIIFTFIKIITQMQILQYMHLDPVWLCIQLKFAH